MGFARAEIDQIDCNYRKTSYFNISAKENDQKSSKIIKCNFFSVSYYSQYEKIAFMDNF